MSQSPVEAQPELESLRLRVAELEARLPPVRRASTSRSRAAFFAALVVLAVGAGTTLAASGACPNGLPFCFTADQPALASEVNHNFAQLKEWLETKVGTTASSDVTSANITAANVSATGLEAKSLRLQGGSTSNVAAAGSSGFFVSGGVLSGDANTGGFEFRHDNLTQGIGFGFNTIYAAGTATDQHLQLKAKGPGGRVNVLSDLGASGAIYGPQSFLTGVNQVGTASITCPSGRKVLWAVGWTNDSNLGCESNDLQVPCAAPAVRASCFGQTTCTYSGASNGCSNAGNTCLAVICM